MSKYIKLNRFMLIKNLKKYRILLLLLSSVFFWTIYISIILLNYAYVKQIDEIIYLNL